MRRQLHLCCAGIRVHRNNINMLSERFLACTHDQAIRRSLHDALLIHRHAEVSVRSACLNKRQRSAKTHIRAFPNRLRCCGYTGNLGAGSSPVAPLTTSTRPAASRATTSCFCEKAGSRCRASRIAAMRGFRATASASAANLLLSAAMSVLGPLHLRDSTGLWWRGPFLPAGMALHVHMMRCAWHRV